MNKNAKPYFVKLPARGLIQIEGADRHDFLQNLVSNDLGLLETRPALYACLLTPQGKFLHDFFVLAGNDVLLLDCEGGERAQDLYQRLLLYRLRAKVQISIEDDHAVYAGTGEAPAAGYADPRHPDIGWRSFEKPGGLTAEAFETWDTHRITLGVPDGSRDMVPQKSTLIESGIDKLNGICFKKGCYVGQELTARMHYRGLAKKHLYTIEGDNLPAPGEDIKTADGKLAGEMRSRSGTCGLALLKDDIVQKGDLAFAVTPHPAAI